MRIVIAEDEKLATERLLSLLMEYDPAIDVMACLESVDESVQYLKQHTHPDLLLLDIHLADGHSFEIFKQVSYHKPVIFTTAYDQYALDAFQMLSIDYILKPVTLENLAKAINKFKSLPASFAAVDFNHLAAGFQPVNFKKRFLGKVGQRLFFVDTQNIAFFQADNKIVYMVDKEGNRYVVDHKMEKLEELLDPRYFFRLNRTFIVNIEAIQQVRPYHNSRLKLYVKGAAQQDEFIISRERVTDFKLWAEA